MTICVILIHGIAQAQEANQPSDDVHAQQSENKLYAYKAEGRPDPFKPFISPKTASSSTDQNEIVEDNVAYSGMQLFEPGQLGLVGIMLTQRGPIAMVEDQTKKGYTLRIGDLIGKRGVVTSIDEHQVIITETARTRSGKEMKNIVTMKIKHEGDK